MQLLQLIHLGLLEITFTIFSFLDTCLCLIFLGVVYIFFFLFFSHIYYNEDKNLNTFFKIFTAKLEIKQVRKLPHKVSTMLTLTE